SQSKISSFDFPKFEVFRLRALRELRGEPSRTIGKFGTNRTCRVSTWLKGRVVYRNFRDRDNELSSPVADACHLSHDLVLEVPGKNQDKVRLCFLDFVRVKDWNVDSWHEVALLVRAQVHRVVDKIGPDTAIVQQSDPFCSCAVGSDKFSFTLGANQKIQQLALRLLCPLGKRHVGLETGEAGGFFSGLEFLSVQSDWLGSILSMASVDS